MIALASTKLPNVYSLERLACWCGVASRGLVAAAVCLSLDGVEGAAVAGILRSPLRKLLKR